MKPLNNTIGMSVAEAINIAAEIVHTNAVEKGFHNFDQEAGVYIAETTANIHGEVSELWESYRKGDLLKPCDKAMKMQELELAPLNCAEEELADIVIRALDTAKRLGVNIGHAIQVKHAYNTTRAYRHGGKLA